MNDRRREDDLTPDYFYHGRVTVFQRRRGYRFSVDSPILADFLPHSRKKRALEVGAGSGIVSLLALYKNKFSHIDAVEIQASLSRLAELNAEKNGFSGRLRIRCADFNRVYRDYAGMDLVFSNPPFLKLDCGRLSPNPEMKDARAETRITLGDLLEKSSAVLGPGGSLFLILPFPRYRELAALSGKIGFYPLRKRLVFSFKTGKPERFLIQLANYRDSFVEMEPLVIFREKGIYTEEMEQILSGNDKEPVRNRK